MSSWTASLPPRMSPRSSLSETRRSAACIATARIIASASRSTPRTPLRNVGCSEHSPRMLSILAAASLRRRSSSAPGLLRLGRALALGVAVMEWIAAKGNTAHKIAGLAGATPGVWRLIPRGGGTERRQGVALAVMIKIAAKRNIAQKLAGYTGAMEVVRRIGPQGGEHEERVRRQTSLRLFLHDGGSVIACLPAGSAHFPIFCSQKKEDWVAQWRPRQSVSSCRLEPQHGGPTGVCS